MSPEKLDEWSTERALAVLNLQESDFGQSGRDIRFLAIHDELKAAFRLGHHQGMTWAAEIVESIEKESGIWSYSDVMERTINAILTERDRREKG